MFDFHEKRKIRSVVYSRPVIGFLFLASILLAYSAYNRYTVARDMEERLNMKREELREVETRAAAIEAKVKHLEDERGLEEELRTRFDAVREGEQVIIFVGEEKKKKNE